MRRLGRPAMFVLLLALSCSRGGSDDGSKADKTAGAKAGATGAAAEGELPGAAPFAPALRARLQRALTARGASYKPRTEHLTADGKPKYTNRLILETSPYLLQHAHNPVNWYPWGDEAFAAAKRLNRPVLLSVGYSTCHWCHVMEAESFEDIEIARYLNEHYVAIKVDREQRPDIDSIYMAAVRHGGWPMTVWLTYDRRPFFGATYFPPRQRPGSRMPGFLQILRHFAEQYAKEPKRIHAIAKQLAKRVQSAVETSHVGTLDTTVLLRAAATRIKAAADPVNGGLAGSRAKFYSNVPLRFLMRYYRRTGDNQALRLVTVTLDKMAAGGVYDQVGGGFHRYATDQRWRVPHFEKMLYANALLVPVYLEAYQLTNNPSYAQVAREILRYVRRDMTSPAGAFYSATDADSPGPDGRPAEGLFFTWTAKQVAAALTKPQYALAKAYYNITDRGDNHGRNILHTTRTLSAVATELRMPVDRARLMLENIKKRLYEARSKRPPPLRDDKVLTAWNGLMISAYARAQLVLGANKDGGPSYLEQAERAARFVLDKLVVDGRLVRSWHDGKVRFKGYLNDYAFFIAGLLDVYEASGDAHWLKRALALDSVLRRYYEAKTGGFYLTASDAEALLAREKPGRDGAVPNGNSVEALNLLRLGQLTTKPRFRARAKKLLEAYAGMLDSEPQSMGHMLLAVDYLADQPKQIVIVPPARRAQAAPLLSVLARTFVPNKVLVVAAQGALATLGKLVPLVDSKKALAGKTTAYVCVQQRCELPTSDPAVFAKQLSQTEKLPSVAATTHK